MKQPQSQMSRQRFVLISILFFHSVNTYMDRACIASAADFIMKDLSISKDMLGLILGIFAVGYALFQIPSGWIADRFGPRKALTIVVSVWSIFTAFTGAARNAIQMLILRFLFGVGEAGAFPGATQAFFRWLPVKERGLAHGINFSGSRLGAALSLFLMPWLISIIGWRWTFAVNGLIGIIWATVWLIWFRDNPRNNRKINQAELDYIEAGRVSDFTAGIKASFAEVFTSLNMSLAMMQYFASNVTFFISLTWLPSYIKNQWPDDPHAIYYSAVPLIFAAFANWIAGSMVTGLFKKGYHVGSRRITAIVGFSLGVIGLILAIQTRNLDFLTTDKAQLYWFVFCFGLATFGVDMTLSPSWAFCNDIGGSNSGAVSGSMNMVGNIGAALSAIIFPLLLNEETGSANTFFMLAAGLNFLAIVTWCLMNPNRISDKNLSPQAIRNRFIAMLTSLVLLTAGTIGYKIYKSTRKETAPVEDTQKVHDENQITTEDDN
ncbi:MAG: MFS transporter [Planctomycetes bacterium]|nr:MFS transporter [Planctomycetota bacterium]MBL7145854.1 MFS transporter [Phycisphaerae bacterium]